MLEFQKYYVCRDLANPKSNGVVGWQAGDSEFKGSLLAEFSVYMFCLFFCFVF